MRVLVVLFVCCLSFVVYAENGEKTENKEEIKEKSKAEDSKNTETKAEKDSEAEVNTEIAEYDTDNTVDEIERIEILTAEERENLFRELKIKRSSQFAFGVNLGLIPDVGGLSNSGPNIRSINTQMSSFIGQYNAKSDLASATLESSGSLEDQAKSLMGIPLGFYLYYYSQFFLVRMGFNYTFSTTAINSLVARQFDPSLTTGDLSPLDTKGKEIKVTSEISMSYFEIPFTIALRFVNVWGSSMYFGAGPSVFIGGWKRITYKNEIAIVSITGDIPDIDIFFTNIIGFHFLIGGEVFINRDIAITAEFSFSKGSSGDAGDLVVSSDINTLKTGTPGLEDINSMNIGASGFESGKEVSQVEFGGFGLTLGIRYIL